MANTLPCYTSLSIPGLGSVSTPVGVDGTHLRPFAPYTNLTDEEQACVIACLAGIGVAGSRPRLTFVSLLNNVANLGVDFAAAAGTQAAAALVAAAAASRLPQIAEKLRAEVGQVNRAGYADVEAVEQVAAADGEDTALTMPEHPSTNGRGELAVPLHHRWREVAASSHFSQGVLRRFGAGFEEQWRLPSRVPFPVIGWGSGSGCRASTRGEKGKTRKNRRNWS